MAKMNKGMLVEALASRADLSKREVEAVLDALVEEVTSQLQGGDEVALTGLGTFKISHRKERQGRNPKTGETMTIPAMRVPKFSAGKALKDAVR